MSNLETTLSQLIDSLCAYAEKHLADKFALIEEIKKFKAYNSYLIVMYIKSMPYFENKESIMKWLCDMVVSKGYKDDDFDPKVRDTIIDYMELIGKICRV